MRRLKKADEMRDRSKIILSWRESIFWMNNIYMKRQSKRLNNKSIELFKIVKDIKKLSYELNLFKKMWIHSVFYAFMLQCCNQVILLQIIETSVELNEEYEVKNILEKRIISEKVHYFIKWKEYKSSENIWELKKISETV
jgi:hypothetical protein